MARYKFDQIAFNSTDKKKPVDEDKKHYIGLEHLDSGSLKVTRWGSEIAPKGEKLLMRKGDVLFGKRRAYQKKVAIAPFDGIFSAHGMVLRPKTEVIDPDFFPLFIASDYFLDAAIKISVGSLSPTINWRDLKELEFDIPSLPVQRKLAKILWAINDTKGAYEQLIQETDELVKSQFIEMFGYPGRVDKGYQLKLLGDVCSVERGGSPRPISDFITNAPDGLNWIKIGDADSGRYITHTAEKIKPEGLSKTRKVYVGDLLLSNSMSFGRPYILKIDGCIHDGWLVLHFDDKVIDAIFLQTFLSLPETFSAFEKMAEGAVVNNLNSSVVKKLPVLLPSIEQQRMYREVIKQSDKSKFELQYVKRNVKEMITCSQKKIQLNR